MQQSAYLIPWSDALQLAATEADQEVAIFPDGVERPGMESASSLLEGGWTDSDRLNCALNDVFQWLIEHGPEDLLAPFRDGLFAFAFQEGWRDELDLGPRTENFVAVSLSPQTVGEMTAHFDKLDAKRLGASISTEAPKLLETFERYELSISDYIVQWVDLLQHAHRTGKGVLLLVG